MREGGLVLFSLVLLQHAEAGTDAILIQEHAVAAQLGAALQPVVIEVIDEVMMKLEVLDIAQKGAVMSIGDFAPANFYVLIAGLIILQHDRISGGAVIFHMRPAR